MQNVSLNRPPFRCFFFIFSETDTLISLKDTVKCAKGSPRAKNKLYRYSDFDKTLTCQL